jgi:hypothetical protein
MTPDKQGPLGFGVTAHSFDDAIEIIKRRGYNLPQDMAALTVQKISSVKDISDAHVQRHMGPIVVRGLWYPFTKLVH